MRNTTQMVLGCIAIALLIASFVLVILGYDWAKLPFATLLLTVSIYNFVVHLKEYKKRG